MSEAKLRFFLRSRTSRAHAALDAGVGALETREAYVGFLRGLYRYRAATEAVLRSLDWPAEFRGWRPRYIGDQLRADLVDLDRAPPEPDQAHLAKDIASLLGVSYVLEGSALGARLVARRAAALGLNERYGARHLAAQTAELTNWHAFLALADDLPGIDRDRAARAANDSFALAADAMSRSAR